MNTTITQVAWGLSGAVAGAGPFIGKRGIDSVAAGKDNFVATKQTFSLYVLARNTFIALKETDLLDVSTAKRRLIILAITPIPFALQIILNYAKPQSVWYKTAELGRDHLSKVVLAVDLCASVLISSAAPPIFGACMAASITIELLRETHLLSVRVKKVWEKVSIGIVFLQTIGSPMLATMTLFECFWAVSELVVHLYEHYIEYSPPEIQHRVRSAEMAKKMMDLTPDQLQIDKNHLNWDPKLGFPVPIDLDDPRKPLDIEKTMQLLLQRIDWKKNLTLLRPALFNNPLFLTAHPECQGPGSTADLIPEELVKNWISAYATEFANSINQEKISSGDQEVRYARIHFMMRCILNKMSVISSQKEIGKKEEHQAVEEFEPYLFQMILANGLDPDSCVVGRFDAVEDVFNSFVLGGTDSALQLKILYRLLTIRKNWFDTMVRAPLIHALLKLPKGIYEPGNRHFNNILYFYPDKLLHLYSENLQNDMTVEDFLCDHLKQFIVSIMGRLLFWPLAVRSDKWYSPKAIMNQLQVDAKDTRFNIKQVKQWTLNWVKPIHELLSKEEYNTLKPEEIQKLQQSMLDNLFLLSLEDNREETLNEWRKKGELKKGDKNSNLNLLSEVLITRLSHEEREILLEVVEKDTFLGHDLMVKAPKDLQDNFGVHKNTMVVHPKILQLILSDMGVLSKKT